MNQKKEPSSTSYSESERQQVINQIENNFGECSHFYIIDDGTAKDLNLLVFSPTEARPYYTMVTLGMGGYQMNMPEILRTEGDKDGHVELVGRLPSYWKFDAESLKEERWYWPIKLLEYVIRLGVHEGAFIDCGFKLNNLKLGDTNFENNLFSGIILFPPICGNANLSCLRLDNEKEIRFCEIGTFFQEEMDFVATHSYSDLESLMKSCPDKDFPVFMDQKRMNYGARETLELPWAREVVEKSEKSRNTFSNYMNQIMERFSNEEHHHHHHHHDHDHDHHHDQDE